MKFVLTVTEAARILRALEGRFALTPRGIRYYARTGMVQPEHRTKGGRSARLYSVVDLGLLRLVCRLHRQRVHERAMWGLLVYRGAELRSMLRAGRGVLAVTDTAALAAGNEGESVPKPIVVDAAAIMAGLSERIAAYRTREPEIWTGAAWVPAAEAEQVLA